MKQTIEKTFEIERLIPADICFYTMGSV